MTDQLRIDHVETNGTFALDGGEWNVDNNIWLVGDDKDVYIIDAAHDANPIIEAVGDRNVRGIICTHGHNDHVTVAPELSAKLSAPIYLHGGDKMLWDMTHPDTGFIEMENMQTFRIAGTDMKVLNTPGHSPGSCCLYLPEANELFAGDTLFQGGPGATGRSFSSFDTIIDSIETSILTLPAETQVRTGHGPHTTVGDEAPYLEEWKRRGY